MIGSCEATDVSEAEKPSTMSCSASWCCGRRQFRRRRSSCCSEFAAWAQQGQSTSDRHSNYELHAFHGASLRVVVLGGEDEVFFAPAGCVASCISVFSRLLKACSNDPYMPAMNWSSPELPLLSRCLPAGVTGLLNASRTVTSPVPQLHKKQTGQSGKVELSAKCTRAAPVMTKSNR